LLQFLNPIWLAAGIGIIIPVAIHLWNVRKGKVLRIGSVLLMSDTTQQKSSSLRVTQWLLLLIRCLLIFMLAMLLAGPEWHANKQKTNKGWVLIEKKDFGLVYSRFKSPIDSLLNKGFELHGADKDLEQINPADSAEFQSDTTSSTDLPLSYWSILRRADKLLPAGYPVYFFSNNKLTDATGTIDARRPVVSIDLRWQMAQPDSTFATVPIVARQLSSGGYQLASFQPSVNGNHFIKTVSQNPPVTSRQTDTSTLRVTIYHDKYPEDLRYLHAALRTIAGFGDYKFSLKTVEAVKDIPGYQDWLFWLSEEIPPADISSTNLFIYQPGTSVTAKSWLVTDDGGVPPNAIKIYQRIPGSAEQRKLVWKDGFGNPLLTLDDTDGLNGITTGDATSVATRKLVYRFYSRFHPAWSNLNWSPDFPKVLFPLIIRDRVKKMVINYDQNSSEVADVIPTVVRQTYKEKKSAFEFVELSNLFWIITFLLFATERIISMKGRNKKQI
jgi:hypothetical protein